MVADMVKTLTYLEQPDYSGGKLGPHYSGLSAFIKLLSRFIIKSDMTTEDQGMDFKGPPQRPAHGAMQPKTLRAILALLPLRIF